MKLSIRCGSLVALVGLTFTGAHAGEKGTPSNRQIGQWVQNLGDEVFAAREAATTNLIKSGETAIKEVAAAATGRDLEVTARALLILNEFAIGSEIETSRAAERALVGIAVSKNPTAARLARTALAPMQKRIATELQACGARVTINGDMIVAVYFDDAKTLGDNLRLLHHLPELESLSFSTPLMDDDGLARLAGLPRVRSLNLYQSRVSDGGMKYLKTLPSLRSVPMGETRVTDQGLIHLKELTQLEYVGLRANHVTDKGLVHLKKLTNLTGLYLGETKVTDAGLIHLRALTKLNTLRLDHTRVSDVGLEHLTAMTELKILDISDTQVTPKGLARLKKALPKVESSQNQP
jgi:hypothetical protein